MYEWVINYFHPNCYIWLVQIVNRSLKYVKSPKNVLEVWSFVILNVTVSGLEKPILRNLVVILKQYKWKLNYHFLSTIKMWAGINKILLPNMMKELHYNILHNIPVILYSQKSSLISSQCTFCNSNLATISHLFFKCDYAKDLWKDMSWLVFSAYTNIFSFKISTVFDLGIRINRAAWYVKTANSLWPISSSQM